MWRGGLNWGGQDYSWGTFGHWEPRWFPTIWFVADVLKLTVGAEAGLTVEVTTDGCLLGV